MAEENGNGKKQVRRVVLEKLRAGEQPFVAWGYSILKRKEATRDGDGNVVEEEFELMVPIKSIGMVETMDRISRKAPTPPIRKEFIRAGSEEAKALGLPHGKIVEIENLADPGYKEQQVAHGRWAMHHMILNGLAMNIEDSDGTIVVQANDTRSRTQIINEDKAIDILKSQGLSNEQFEQLYKDITDLTRREQERVDQE